MTRFMFPSFVTLKSILVLGTTLMVAFVLGYRSLWGEYGAGEEGRRSRPGTAHPVQTAYEQWSAAHRLAGGDRRLVLPLGWSKGLSTTHSTAHGQAVFDFLAETVDVEVQGLSETKPFDVWLVDNRPGDGRSVLPEPGDEMIRLGRLAPRDGAARLHAAFDREALTGFHIDLVVVAPGGSDPSSGGLLFGAPTLFQRVYLGAAARSPGVAPYPGPRHDTVAVHAGLVGAGFIRSLFARPAPVTFEDLVAQGGDLFVNETFDGNGRTCATCHPASNNFTIDPAFIATLPEDDPLFVAEFNDALNFKKNGGRYFENPLLMRAFGLIVENVDGFGDLTSRFTLRSVPHTLALPTALAPSPDDGTTQPPYQRTGWSGDGAPGGGTLRAFAIGAVTQHFPKTLARQAGVDFRLPTEEELDALEAFQLSLGRQQELDVGALTFKDPNVIEGAMLFQGLGRGGTCCACSTCHINAGASPNPAVFPDGGNRNFNTGVENFPNPAAEAGERIPRDGGFGQTPGGDGAGGFGDGTFNTPVLVEAADTPPFMHNNSVPTIEEAVAFYESEAFNGSPARLALLPNPVDFTEEEIQQLADFLRVINALENLREAVGLLERTRPLPNDDEAENALERVLAESFDGRQVLTFGRRDPAKHPTRNIHWGAIRLIRRSEVFTRGALAALRRNKTSLRNRQIDRAIALLGAARADMVDDGPPVAARAGEASSPAIHAEARASSERIPTRYALAQNYPNPFNPTTTIAYQLPEPGQVSLRVYDLAGREVARLVDAYQEAGRYDVSFEAKGLPSGVYLYRLRAGAFEETGRMTLLK